MESCFYHEVCKCDLSMLTSKDTTKLTYYIILSSTSIKVSLGHSMLIYLVLINAEYNFS